jgi:hypothetical protein
MMQKIKKTAMSFMVWLVKDRIVILAKINILVQLICILLFLKGKATIKKINMLVSQPIKPISEKNVKKWPVFPLSKVLVIGSLNADGPAPNHEKPSENKYCRPGI